MTPAEREAGLAYLTGIGRVRGPVAGPSPDRWLTRAAIAWLALVAAALVIGAIKGALA